MRINFLIFLELIVVKLLNAFSTDIHTFELHRVDFGEQIGSGNTRMLETLTPIYGNSSYINYYFVNMYVGTPPKMQSLITDTGSSVTTIPCQPLCEACGKHLNSYYNMTGMC
jgi:hypothetical protein